MPVIITGASGQIGCELALRLSSNNEIVAFHRTWKDVMKVLSQKHVKLVQTDLVNMTQKADSAEFVYHLAASINAPTNNPIEIINENIRMTFEVLEFMRKTDSSNLIFASTSAVYGSGNAMSVREEDFPYPEWSGYATSKYLCERICLHYCKLYSLKAVIARIFPVYGGVAESPQRLIPLLFRKMLAGQDIHLNGGGRQMRDLIHISDVCDALSCIQKDFSSLHHQIYNIGTGRGTKLTDLVTMISKIMDIEPIVNCDCVETEDSGNIANITRIQNDLGFAPRVSLEDGLALYFEDIKSRGFTNNEISSLKRNK